MLESIELNFDETTPPEAGETLNTETQKPTPRRNPPNRNKPAIGNDQAVKTPSRPAPQKKDFNAIMDTALTVAKAYNPKTAAEMETAWSAGLVAAKAINKL